VTAAVSGVTVVVEDLAGVVIALVVAALVAVAASADSAAAAGADGNNLGLGFASNFPYNQKTQSTHSNKHMKKLLTVTGIASIGMVLALISASEAIAASGSEISRKEALLAQSGFKVVTVTTPKQKEAVHGLAQGRCSAVTFNKKLFYVFPTATKDKIYVGKQGQFDRYKKAIAAQQGSKPAKM
jgi:hypothetical protein